MRVSLKLPFLTLWAEEIIFDKSYIQIIKTIFTFFINKFMVIIMKINKLTKTLFVGALMLSLSQSQAYADNFAQDSYISLLNVLNITETKQLNFGTIEVPSSDIKVHITKDGNIGGENTATHIDTSTIEYGKFKVFGSDLNSISISATNGGSVANMAFEKLEAKYKSVEGDIISSALTGLDAPKPAGTDLDLGAVLTVAANTAEGVYAPDFNLEVNYE